MSKTKTVRMKLLYVIATLAALAMLIPMAIPVSAADLGDLIPAESHNVIGAEATFMATPTFVVDHWAFGLNTNGAAFVGTPGTGAGASATIVAYTEGEAVLIAYDASGNTQDGDKKWGKVVETDITEPQDEVLTWNESAKEFSASVTISDEVTALFEFNVPGGYVDFVDEAGGMILHWFLLHDCPATQYWVMSHSGWETPSALLGSIPDDPATFAVFENGLTEIDTITDDGGDAMVTVSADGEEPVLVVVIPEYPVGVSSEIPVFVEWTKVNFWTSEMEVVPQVRWVGEKIVLEKFFGTGMRPNETTLIGAPAELPWPGTLVNFKMDNWSVGNLIGIGAGANLANFTNSSTSVWSIVGEDGYARVMLLGTNAGEAQVDLAVYNANIMELDSSVLIEGTVINQHSFLVYYLKLEQITLGNVVGKRAGHYIGPWTPPNPWKDPATGVYGGTADETDSTLNVSQDALLRAQVKGWFMGDLLSTRPATPIDSNGNGYIGTLDPAHPDYADVLLPAGRWVLPDDWPYLAGPDWIESRIHWDIMDAPNDIVYGVDPDGPYFLDADLDYECDLGEIVAYDPVIGPFRPGIELPTDYGYDPMVQTWAIPQQKSVVPNGALDVWDAPMPPAKVTFVIQDPNGRQSYSGVYALEISDNAGFFKDAPKPEIYYLPIDPTDPESPVVFTNPFYLENIPAFWQIPAFVNNGGYDWSSWVAGLIAVYDEDYGPYPFWKIINRPTSGPVSSSDSANCPTKVQVYSDNHGEAMVYLNGDWNMNLVGFMDNGAADIAPGTIVGTTTVKAIADYPYFRKDISVYSNLIEKTWLWGGEIMGTDQEPADYYPPSDNPSMINNKPMILSTGSYNPADVVAESVVTNKKLVFIWVTDRDNLPYGMKNAIATWEIDGAAKIADPDVLYDGTPLGFVHGVSIYNTNTQNIDLQDGFLAGTGGYPTDAPYMKHGISGFREPTLYEKDIFLKSTFWPLLNPDDYLVSAVEIISENPSAPEVSILVAVASTDFAISTPVGTIWRYINVNFGTAYPLDDGPIYGDANIDGVVNMGDVTAVERAILGITGNYIGADANQDNEVDMGDVVKIERMILHLD